MFKRTMRRELSYYILGLSVITALAFFVLLNIYFEQGLDKAARTTMLMDARTYEALYKQDPTTPLPSSYTMRFFLDDWKGAPAFYQKAIPFDELKPAEFFDIEWSPHDIVEWQDAHYIIIYWHKLFDGRNLFVVSDYDANLLTTEEQNSFDHNFYRIFYFVGAYLLLMLLAVWFYNRRINRHTQRLAAWAEAMTLDNINQPRSDFRYVELNCIAEQLQQAFERIASLLEREHHFLRHASHELRTPIAIVRANIELLDRIGIPATIERPISRIRRANHGMLQLTETLLWLSRENEAAPTPRAVEVDQMLDELIEELEYLLQDKALKIIRHYDSNLPCLQLPETPLRIVLSNLIRNAFQYTYEGQVSFTVKADRLVIENQDKGEKRLESDDSFGLGLILVKQICERMQWSLQLIPQEKGVRAELELPIKVE